MYGLSPPTRGSRQAVNVDARKLGSIPAHTGKPSPGSGVPGARRVYPRPHGEAFVFPASPSPLGGLSPPTRGSLCWWAHRCARQRSIPAHTGKPSRSRSAVPRARVYPRPHGEAGLGRLRAMTANGLSPPTRGSRPEGGRVGRRDGSIPAHTGKPRRRAGILPPGRVYPRPHGEAEGGEVQAGGVRGLSPPTRGSRCGEQRTARLHGSIPAHTGKPAARGSAPTRCGVYPRPHGEARRRSPRPRPRAGLSPPTRGSLARQLSLGFPPGSIPAHTGKP